MARDGARSIWQEGDPAGGTPTAPSALTIGRIDDGEYLMRDGSVIKGGTPSGGGGGGAPTNASYVVIGLNGTLTDERRLQVGTGLSLTDGGANGDATIAPALDLAALEGLSGTGIAVRTAASTWTLRTIGATGAGLSVTNGDGVSGAPSIALADDVAAVEALTGTGLAARTAASTWALRSLTVNAADAALMAITNPAGVAGDPEFSLDPLEIVSRWVHPMFGDASDGDLTLSGDISLTRDMQYDTLDLAGFALNCDGKRLRCRELRNTGGAAASIHNNGTTSTNRSGGNSTGAGTLGQGSAGGNGGLNTQNGVAGSGRNSSYAAAIVGGAASDGSAGGISGGGQTGGGGGAATAYTTNTNGIGGGYWVADGVLPSGLIVNGGSGGGGGGSTGSGFGGGGGGGGGVCMAWAHTLHSSVTSAVVVSADGGGGGPGTSTGGTGHGGGGGGGGGYARLVYSVDESTTLPTVSAVGGTGGTAAGTGVAGVDGEDGLAELVRLGV